MSDSDEVSEMNISIQLGEDADLINVQEQVIAGIKEAAEDSGAPFTIEQWEILKTATKNGALIFCRLADEEIEKLKVLEGKE